MKHIWLLRILATALIGSSGFSFAEQKDSLPFSGKASFPNILTCRLTKELIPNDHKPEDVTIPGKKIDMKTLGGESTHDTWTFAALNSNSPIAKNDMLVLYGGKEQPVQLLHREGRRIIMGFFKSAAPIILDLYFPKDRKAFLWFHLLGADYLMSENPLLDSASWGECE